MTAQEVETKASDRAPLAAETESSHGAPVETLEMGEQADEDKTPDGGYGWVIVGCLIGLNAVTWGGESTTRLSEINTTYGVFQSYYLEHNYFAGGNAMRYGWVGGLSAAVALTCGPIGNLLQRTWNFRVPLVLGMICTVMGQISAGLCTNFGSFLFCQGILYGIGLGLTLVPCQPILAHWFDRRLSLAQGIANCGSGLGGLVLSQTTRLALERLGVKWALIINGLISLVVSLPVLFLLKGRHKQVGARSAPFQIGFLWHPGYVWVLIWAGLCMISYFIAIYSLASFATDGLGLTQSQGAILQSVLSAGQLVGRPFWGYMLDKGGRINMSILCYLISGISCLAIWLPARSFGVLIFFAIVQGICGGIVWNAITPLTARVVGVQDLSSALSILYLVIVTPALIGQPCATALRDYSIEHLGRTGADAYSISIGFCGGTGIAAGLMLYGAKRYMQDDWKVLKVM